MICIDAVPFHTHKEKPIRFSWNTQINVYKMLKSDVYYTAFTFIWFWSALGQGGFSEL